MAIYFRDTPDPGAALGRGLTQGLETGLQHLLGQKLKQVQQQQLKNQRKLEKNDLWTKIIGGATGLLTVILTYLGLRG